MIPTVQTAQSLFELLLALRRLGSVQGSQATYSPTDLWHLICRYLTNPDSSGATITNHHGIRDKAIELRGKRGRPAIDFYILRLYQDDEVIAGDYPAFERCIIVCSSEDEAQRVGGCNTSRTARSGETPFGTWVDGINSLLDYLEQGLIKI